MSGAFTESVVEDAALGWLEALGYSSEFQNEILRLPAGFVARFLRYAERMEIYGPTLGMPHTPAMGEGLVELRLKAAADVAAREG
jgi:hypothetical protein